MVLIYIQIFNKYLPHFSTVLLLNDSVVNRNLILKINVYPFLNYEFLNKIKIRKGRF